MVASSAMIANKVKSKLVEQERERSKTPTRRGSVRNENLPR